MQLVPQEKKEGGRARENGLNSIELERERKKETFPLLLGMRPEERGNDEEVSESSYLVFCF